MVIQRPEASAEDEEEGLPSLEDILRIPSVAPVALVAPGQGEDEVAAVAPIRRAKSSKRR